MELVGNTQDRTPGGSFQQRRSPGVRSVKNDYAVLPITPDTTVTATVLGTSREGNDRAGEQSGSGRGAPQLVSDVTGNKGVN